MYSSDLAGFPEASTSAHTPALNRLNETIQSILTSLEKDSGIKITVKDRINISESVKGLFEEISQGY